VTEYTAHPLAWPAAWPREKNRKHAPFHRRMNRDGQAWKSKERLTVDQSRLSVRHELKLLGASGVVISSNLRLRIDGEPMSSQPNPDDPGVCVYFTLNKKPRCLPCDRWIRAADNLAAIAKYVEAMRGQIRWGVGSVDAMFAGFKALPGSDTIVPQPPMTTDEAAQFLAEAVGRPLSKPEFYSDAEAFRTAYRTAVKIHHPDANGGIMSGAWLDLQRAADSLRLYHGGGK